MTTSEASARGKSNRMRGRETEQIVARWLRSYYPDACRAVRNSHPDPGDVDCTSPGLWWSIKYTQVESINTWFEEIAVKADTRIGLLVQRRSGKSDPGRWWCWLRLADLRALLSGTDLAEFVLPELTVGSAPVRLELQHVMELLVAANYAPKAAG